MRSIFAAPTPAINHPATNLIAVNVEAQTGIKASEHESNNTIKYLYI